MKKSKYVLGIFLVISSFLMAKSWEISSDFNLTASQNFYTDNWHGGENSNLAWVVSSNTLAEKQIAPLWRTSNSLKLAFGQTHKSEKNASGEYMWEKPEKSTDKIDFESIFKMTSGFYINLFISGRCESQFIDLSDSTITQMFNPLNLTEAAGIGRDFISKKEHKLSARLGGALRQHIYRDMMDVATGKRDTEVVKDGGFVFYGDYFINLVPPTNIKYTSKLELFQAIYNSKEDELPNEYWKELDIVWLNTISMSIYKALQLQLYFEYRYDKEQDKAGQFKETLGLNLSLNLY